MAEAKQLRIKAGSVSRLHREISIYNEEVATQQAVVDRLKQQSGDSHDIKHAENVLQESRMMIPDTQSRLEAAVAELQKLLEDAPPSVRGGEEYGKAEAAVSEAQRTQRAVEA